MANPTSEDLTLLLGQIEWHFRHIEDLYQTLKAAGLHEKNDENAKLVRGNLERLEIAHFLTRTFMQVPHATFAPEAIESVHQIVTQAGRIMNTEWARRFLVSDRLIVRHLA